MSSEARSGAHCHRCGKFTATQILALSSGHLGNCCAVCRATRKGRPFVSRKTIQSNAAASGQRSADEQLPIRRR